MMKLNIVKNDRVLPLITWKILTIRVSTFHMSRDFKNKLKCTQSCLDAVLGLLLYTTYGIVFCPNFAYSGGRESSRFGKKFWAMEQTEDQMKPHVGSKLTLGEGNIGNPNKAS